MTTITEIPLNDTVQVKLMEECGTGWYAELEGKHEAHGSGVWRVWHPAGQVTYRTEEVESIEHDSTYNLWYVNVRKH
jgi:hypothetical protein